MVQAQVTMHPKTPAGSYCSGKRPTFPTHSGCKLRIFFGLKLEALMKRCVEVAVPYSLTRNLGQHTLSVCSPVGLDLDGWGWKHAGS